MKWLSLNATRSLPKRLTTCLKMACLFALLHFGTSHGSSPPLVASNSVPSPLIANVIKLRNAKVAPEVIKAYVQNTPVRVNVSAEQIVALHKSSVPAEIIKAIIERSEPRISTGLVSPSRPSPTRPSASVPRSQSTYALGSPGWPRPPYPSGGTATSYPAYSPFLFPSFSPVGFGLVSFNNSFPTYINGYPVYSGVGLAPMIGSVTFNNSYPTYVNGIAVYAGSYFW
jgi:hypothetical protein